MMRSNFFVNTFGLLCVCVFMVYQMQEVALNKMEALNTSFQRPPILAFHQIVNNDDEDLFLDHSENEAEISKYPNRPPSEASRELVKPTTELSEIKNLYRDKIWITMALCWSTNTVYHGKEKFPYSDAAPLSAQLWMTLTKAKVILQIVYSEDKVPADLAEYKERLEGLGVLVKLVRTGEEMKCVLKAQLIRLLAFELPEVTKTLFFFNRNVSHAHEFRFLRSRRMTSW